MTKNIPGALGKGPLRSRSAIRLSVRLVLSAWLVASAVTAVELQAQTPGPNVNMVSGTSLPDGDPYLQRQNETSGAVSTRNPLHLLAGANDYRTVDIPIEVGNKEESNGDAWLGLFKSFDGGQSWHSSLLPGFPQDQSAVGLASPLRGFAAGADPTVRAGTNGLFYYSGLAFNRGTNGLGVVFVARLIDNNNDKAKYDNKNGKYLSNDPIAYIDTKVIDSGTAGRFADKPWIAVDIPRAGAGTCSIQSGGTTQTIKAGNVYISYIVAVGNDKNPVTQMMVARSTNCGATWSKPIKVSERVHISQGSTLAIDPNNGTLYLAWREIGDKTTSDGIIIAKSTDFGKTFTQARTVSKITPFDQGGSNFTFRTRAFPSMAVDASGRVYLAWSQRGVGPASAAPIPGGVVPPEGVPTGDARIMLTTSLDGVSWTPPTAIDNDMGRRGHQIQPVLNVTAGKVTATFYDFRDDVSRLFEPYISDANIGSRSPTGKRHTMDVWVWQANPAAVPTSGGSVKVSQYLTGFRNPTLEKPKPTKEQLQFNAPNLPLFGQGKIAFVGDYMDLFGLSFITDATGQNWSFNAAAGGPSATYAVWTDNRDVRPPKDGNWTNYTRATPGDAIPDAFKSPGAAQCVPGQTGMRNSNIYSSRITPGLYVGSPTNSKKLDGTQQRSFVVFVQNTSDEMKTFRLEAPAATSWFQFQPPPTGVDPRRVDITVAPRSTTSRTLYVTSASGSLKVEIEELDLRPKGSTSATNPKTGGLKAYVVLNPDITNPDVTNTEVFNPDVTNPDVTNPDVTNFSVTTPDVTNSNIRNPDVTNPDVTNPDVTNPDVTNPDVTNVSIANPDVTNPDVTNPDVTNPDVTNPDVTNPDVTNPDVTNQSITDVTWTVTNNGTTAGSFAVKPFVTKNAPPGFLKQLILHKRYATPVTTNVGKAALDDCKVYTQVQNVLLANIIAPDVTNPDVTNPDVTNPDVTNPDVTNNLVTNPDVTNASIWLDSGDSAQITMRVLNPNKTSNPVATKTVTQSNGKKQIVVVSPQFEAAKSATPLVASVAVDTGKPAGSNTFEAPLVVVTQFLPDVVASQVLPDAVDTISPRILASGGVVGPRTWCVLPVGAIPNGTCPEQALPPAPGLALNPTTGVIFGSPTTAGAFLFTVQVSDTASPTHYNTQDLFIRVAPFAVADTKTTPEDTVLQFAATELLLNDAPVAVNLTTSLMVTSVAATANTRGTVSLLNGVVTYTPQANYNGPASFTYTAALTTIYDGTCCYPATNLVYPGLTSTGTVSLNIVSAVNDPPIPANDAYSTPEDTPLTIAVPGVLANDLKGPSVPAGTQDDELGQTLTATVVQGQGPAHGQLTLNPDGSFSYSPTLDYNGPDSFTYRACDNGVTNGATDPKCVVATVNLTVTEVNDPPVGTADVLTSVAEDSGVRTISFASLLGNDSTGPANESGQTLTITAVGNAVGGSVAISGTDVQFTPAADFNGAASFLYTLQDNGTTNGVNTFLTATATASFTITEVNDSPTTVADSQTAVEDTPLTFAAATLATNDSKGPANESGQTLTVISVSATSAQGGTVSLTAGQITYTPAANYSGPDSFTYTVEDDGTTSGVLDKQSGVGTVNVTVTPVNDPPTANDDAQDGTEDVPLTFAASDLVANDSAGPGETGQQLTVTAVALQISSPAIPLAIGSIASAFTGPAVCRPGYASPQCTAQPYDTSQNLAFGRPAVATSTLPGYPAIHAAAFVNDGFYGNGASWIGNTANSSITIDLGQLFWITRLSFGRDRTGGYNDRDPGQFTISTSDDNVAFAPQFGSAAHAFSGSINGAETVEARLRPVRARWIRLTLAANGAAVDEIEVFGSIGPPATVTQGDVTLVNGQVTFTPVADFNGATSFLYTVCDDGVTNGTSAPLCATAAVDVAVAAVNDAPSFTKGADQVVFDNAGAQTVTSWATNLSVGPPDEALAGQTLNFIVSNGNNSLFLVQPNISPAGTLIYRPKVDANGTATVTVSLHDSGGGTTNGDVSMSAAETFTITVNRSNQPPVAVNDSASNFRNLASLQLNGLKNGNLPAVVSTGDGNVLRLAQSGVGDSRGGAFTAAPVSVARFSTKFQFRITDPCCFSDGTGIGADGFTFTLHADPRGALALQPAPDAVGGTGLGYLGITRSVAVEFDTWNSGPEYGDSNSNHLGINFNGSVLSLQTLPVSPPFDNGALWTAWIDYDGSTLEIRVSLDGLRPPLPTMARTGVDIPNILGTGLGYVGFTAATGGVTETFDIVNWTYWTPNASAAVLGNDTDPELDSLSVISFTDPIHGTVVVNADGTFTYTPTAGYTGTDSFTYTIGDGHGNTATATVNITVTVSPPP